MHTTADLSSYGPIMEAVEQFLDSLPDDGYLLRPNQEIVASNQWAVNKGLVQGIKCHSLVSDKPCQWCHAGKALSSGKPVDYIVHVSADENGNMMVVDSGGIVADAHWYPIAPDLYIHFVGICQPMVSDEDREKTYKNIKIFLDQLFPGSTYAEESIQSIKDAMAAQDY